MTFCFGCGHKGYKRNECVLCIGHPDRSNEATPWRSCKIFKKYSEQYGNSKWILPLDTRADGGELFAAEKKAMEKAKKALTDKGKIECINSVSTDILDTSYLHPSYISTNLTNWLFVNILIDSGALQANYVNTKIAAWIKEQHDIELPVCKQTNFSNNIIVNLGGTSNSIKILGLHTFSIKIFNELSKEYDILNCLDFKVLDSKFDIILGRPTIRKFKLIKMIPSYFLDSLDEESSLSEYASRPVQTTKDNHSCGCAHSNSPSIYLDMCGCTELENHNYESPMLSCPRTRILSRGFIHPVVSQQLCIISNIKDKEELLDYEPDVDNVKWPENPFEITFVKEVDAESLLKKIHLSGSASLQEHIYELCEEFIDIFSETVRPNPADIPPMEIKVNLEKWHSNKHRGPPRPQTKSKQREIEKQVSGYVQLHVVEPSTAAYYSQVHLVPKPNPDEWRFCLDYVKFNDCTEGIEGWPIPNISHMINRIGEKKPKIFGVMDMTAGYHQAPLSKSARMLTAFICFMGVFQWLRVPMGLKNAAAYFQRVMATVVLAGLMYISCELYIDDVLVFGQDEKSFIANLRAIFTRFRKYKVTLNPKKCKLRMLSKEYVGHVLNEEGITFSKEKREKVLEFPIPQRMKELSGFLGLVNYFRDHISDMSGKVKPLRKMVISYEKNKKVEWTPELEETFFKIRDEIGNCPSLFFVDENAPIIVMTDASDYGIGAYIYQMIDNKEKPIVFMSKALHGAELNWSTIEKEAYAIYYT